MRSILSHPWPYELFRLGGYRKERNVHGHTRSDIAAAKRMEAGRRVASATNGTSVTNRTPPQVNKIPLNWQP